MTWFELSVKRLYFPLRCFVGTYRPLVNLIFIICLLTFFNLLIGSWTLSSDFSYPYSVGSVSFSNIYSFDEGPVLESLSGLKLTYLPGPDELPSWVVIWPLYSMGYWRLVIFHLFGIIPLYKSCNIPYISNCRDIAKLSAIPTLMEKLVTNYLFFDTKSLISQFEHGFLKGRSTVTNLLEFTIHVFRGFLARARTDVIYTDYSKAFDRNFAS